MLSSEVVITQALRTPVGNFNGAFASVPAHELGAHVIKALLSSSGLQPNEISEVVMGQVLTSLCGQNPARQASILAGLPQETPAWLVNQVCGSGLRSVAQGVSEVLTGQAEIVIAGGQENMSLAPHATHLRTPTKMGDAALKDSMIVDGLWEAFNDYHMGKTAENIAEAYQISRQDQDAFACSSQNKAEAAQKSGAFNNEIVPVTVKKRKEEVVVEVDEFPRHGVTAEALAKLRPAFIKDGTVTAGNASGLNDGAAAVVLMSAQNAQQRGLTPLAIVKSFAHAGVDPKVMGTGPIPATQKALEKAGWFVDELDLIEANEAFAAQALCVSQELGLDASKVNVNGGAIAIGHPIGASGTRILVTLLHAMEQRDAKKGLATLCVGGGMGVAMCLERP